MSPPSISINQPKRAIVIAEQIEQFPARLRELRAMISFHSGSQYSH
jgi:hypothetical protein